MLLFSQPSHQQILGRRHVRIVCLRRLFLAKRVPDAARLRPGYVRFPIVTKDDGSRRLAETGRLRLKVLLGLLLEEQRHFYFNQ